MGLEDIVAIECGQIVWAGVRFLGGCQGVYGGTESPDHIVLDVGSGSYSFHLEGAAPA
jgi:hypothetical protein